MKRRTVVVEVAEALTLAVARGADLDAAQARTLVEQGAVYLAGRRAKDAEAQVQPGQMLTVVLEEGGRSTAAPLSVPAPLVVLFEDEDVLVVDKAPGVVAQPTPGRAGDSLLDLATKHLGFEAGLVHRLDAETSGVTVFGKHKDATSRLAAAFREGRVNKRYVAVAVRGLPREGRIDWPLSKDPKHMNRWRASLAANGIEAVTDYRVLHAGKVSLLDLYPRTGRTHQLRAHLAAFKCPIVGDKLYGGPPGPRCLLHAQTLKVLGWKWEAPLPLDLAGYFEAAGVELPVADFS